MNLGLLCQQENFQNLILNYVAYAGILKIDDVYMSTQIYKYKKIDDLIKKNSDTGINQLALYKDRKFQHLHKTDFAGHFFITVGRVIYKWIYFYIMPLTVIPIGILGWR